MAQSTTPDPVPEVCAVDLTLLLRARVREAIEAIVEEELTAAIGCRAGERSGDRTGHRHGAQVRDVITEHGPTPLQIPRGRLLTEQGQTVGQEFHTQNITAGVNNYLSAT